jgi:AcrR family transcriptional regulator
MARTGRRRGPSLTRAAILDAAARRFAEAGYDAASLRAIAAEAGVDPAVVLHFFGSKDGLFQAAVGWPFDPSGVMDQMAAAGPGSIGERLARVFLHFWEEPAIRASLLAVLRSAMTHEASAELLREFIVSRLFAQVSGLVHQPDAELRVDLASAQLIGMAVLRYALRVEPIASARPDELVAWLTPPLNHYLSESSDPPRPV